MATSSFKLLLSPLFANITSVFLQERKKQSPKYSNKPHSELIYNIKYNTTVPNYFECVPRSEF